MMQYQETRPNHRLARFVECFWTLDSGGISAGSQPERILPDGCVELVLNCAEPFRELKPGGEQVRQPAYFLVGQMTRPVTIIPTGAVALIGIRFHPGGTFPFFRFPMHEVTNQVVELAALSSDLEREFADIVERAASTALKIEALEKLLIDRIRTRKHDPHHDSWIIRVTSEIVARAGQLSMDALAESASISHRQLERRFNHDVGIGPKLFCRVLRFQEIFRALDRSDPQWAIVAANCGYYDQTHLIRDFQQFAHQTPAAVLSFSGRLTESFTRKHRMSDFSYTRESQLI